MVSSCTLLVAEAYDLPCEFYFTDIHRISLTLLTECKTYETALMCVQFGLNCSEGEALFFRHSFAPVNPDMKK